MKKKFEIGFAIFMFLFGCAIGAYFAFYFHFKEHKDDVEPIVVPDTTYNKVVLDSIDYNIKIKDSIIIKLKKKVEYEIDKAINANDSITLMQFRELAGTD